MYADDTQLYLAIEPSNVSDIVFSLENCIKDVKSWMLENKLQLNDDKTEVMLINPKNTNLMSIMLALEMMILLFLTQQKTWVFI